jgi:hypothetical protein
MHVQRISILARAASPAGIAPRPALREPGVCRVCGNFGSGTPVGCSACGLTGL